MLKTEQFGRVTWTQAEIDELEREPRPRFTGLSHVSLPVRDVAEARRWGEVVLGGRCILHLEDFAEVVVGGTILGFSQVRCTPNDRTAEFPHVAFFVESKDFVPMKEWLEAHGVKTHPIWTRGAVEGLMYFKDPSGNLFEIYCKNYDQAGSVQRSPSVTQVVNLPDLDYEWSG